MGRRWHPSGKPGIAGQTETGTRTGGEGVIKIFIKVIVSGQVYSSKPTYYKYQGGGSWGVGVLVGVTRGDGRGARRDSRSGGWFRVIGPLGQNEHASLVRRQAWVALVLPERGGERGVNETYLDLMMDRAISRFVISGGRGGVR